MSKYIVFEYKCDICGDTDVINQRHYEITLREFSTINGDYFKPNTIHICISHNGETIPYNLLFEVKGKS